MTPRPASTVHGMAVVDKPAGWTSHDVVAKARTLLGERRIGHAGTLDPDATGVLVLGVGRATRLLPYLTALPKAYVGELVLGVETSTLDAGGEVVATHPMDGVGIDAVRAVLPRFTGAISQVPPMVSAVKVGGRRLHELAREGREVERRPRPVTVHELVASPVAEPGVFRLEVRCSSGTYVRALAADIGRALGGGAHLRSLRRTAVGSFTLDEARPLERVELRPPVVAVRDFPSVAVDSGVAAAVAHGQVLDRHALGLEGEGPWAVLDGHGALLAVYERRGEEAAKPAVVLC